MSGLRRYLFPAICVFFLLPSFPIDSLQAQSLSLFEIDPSAFPTIRARVMALDRDGNPIRLERDRLELHEDGILRSITFLSCPDPGPVVPISSVLTLDISGSMQENLARNLSIAQAAARAWIEGTPLGISECAVTSFNDGSFLNQDFTIDSRKLLDAVNSLKPQGGTSYDDALIAPQTGAIPVALKGKHKRVIVFLTDGRGGGNEAEIVRRAVAGDITIHCITIGFPAPPILKNIAARTGGLWFENVTTSEKAVEIYRLLLQQSQGGEPCTIEWQSGPACDSLRRVTLDETSLGLHAEGSYIVPQHAIARLETDVTDIRFGAVTPGSTDDRTLRLTAQNSPVTVLSVTSSDPRITVVANGAPPQYAIPAGGFRDVTLRFAPTDESFVFAEITILTDGCAKTIYAAGGTWGSGGSGNAPDIRLVAPNGGERFPVGSMAELTWTGVLPTDTVTLEYSTDAGNTWLTITDKGTGLRHPWEVPNTPSERCLARVSVNGTGGSGTGQPLAKRILTYRGHTGPVNVVRFSPDGKYVASGSGNIADSGRIWEALSGNLYYGFTPAGAVADLDYSSNGEQLAVAVESGEWQLYDVRSARRQRIDRQSEPNITAVSLSNAPEGTLATGNAAGFVKYWNLSTSAVTRTFASGVGGVSSLDFSPATNELLVAGNAARLGDTIRIYDLSGLERKKFPDAFESGHTQPVESARFSRNGNRIISAGLDGAPRIWDRLGNKPRATLGGHTDAVLSPDGTMAVTGIGAWGGRDFRARMWDAATGGLLGMLDAHTAAVVSVDFSPDGRYIVTGSKDSTAIIWELQNPDTSSSGPASDVSDNLWAIVAAGVSSRDVDFGRVLVGKSVDSTLTAYIRNTGGIELEVTGMRITGADNLRFQVVSGLPPFTVPPGGTQSIELRFAPDAIRRFNAQLEIGTNIDTLVQNITGEGVAPLLRVQTTIVDFGRVEVGDAKDSIVTAVITNVGTAPVAVTETEQRGPDMNSFAILAGGGAFTLGPNESRTLTLRFAPLESGRTSGSVGFHFNGPGSPALVVLFGEGYCPITVARAVARTGDTTAPPGDTISIPFTLAPLDPLAPSPPAPPLDPLDFTATFAFNKSLLAPVDRSTVTAEDAGTASAAFSGTWDPTDNSITWHDKPQFVAALGNAESTPIVLEGIEWSRGCPPDVALYSGTFRTDSLCREGDTRLFSETGTLKLEPVQPNPAGTALRLRFELIETGPTALYVVGMNGERIWEMAKDGLEAGIYSAQIDVSAWPQGAYMVVLQTPTAQLNRMVRVAR